MRAILYLSIFSELTRLVFGEVYISRKATFIAPASPSATRAATFGNIAPTETLSFARSQLIAGGYGLYPTSSNDSYTQLNAKKKKAAPVTKKIQVKLLKHIAGTGRAGQVIQVTPAFFNNKLRPQQAATIISDEEVSKEAIERREKEDAKRTKANELRDQLNEVSINIKRKAGPDGQLFGGVGPKLIMKELQSEVGDEFLRQKWVKVAEVLDENGKKLRGDIKTIGGFVARINLSSDTWANIGINIEAE